MNIALIFFALMAAGGVVIALGLLRPMPATPADKFAAKLAQIDTHALSLEEMELSQPFAERFLLPLRDRLSQLVTSRTPARRQEQLRSMIATAGHPMGATVGGIVVAKFIAAAAFGALGAFLFVPFLHVAFPLSLLGGVFGIIGWILPDRWLKQRADARRNQIDHAIPDTIDLLTICLDAGLSFDAALQRVSEKVDGPLHDELDAMLTEVRLGRPREEAMTALADRVNTDDLTAFVNVVNQSQKLGVSIGETVRIQAAEIRRRRRQRAEEKAAQAPLKMLFPMVGCIFPVIFIVLMGPVALLLISRFH